MEHAPEHEPEHEPDVNPTWIGFETDVNRTWIGGRRAAAPRIGRSAVHREGIAAARGPVSAAVSFGYPCSGRL